MPADFQRTLHNELLAAVRADTLALEDFGAALVETVRACVRSPAPHLNVAPNEDGLLDEASRRAFAAIADLTQGARIRLQSTTTVDQAIGVVFRDKVFRARLADEIRAPALGKLITALSTLAPPTQDAPLSALRSSVAVAAGPQPGARRFGTLKSRFWPDIEGFVDRIEGPTIGGWARATTHPHRRVHVVLRMGAAIVAEALADQPRRDLFDRKKGDGRHGFILQAPEHLLADGPIEATVEVVAGARHVLLRRGRVTLEAGGKAAVNLSSYPQTASEADAETLASASADDIARALIAADHVALTRRLLARLYRSGDVEKILDVDDAVATLAPAGLKPSSGAAQLQLSFGRVMLAMNAAETAFTALSTLLENEELRSQLDTPEIALAVNLAGRAALRSGRGDEARRFWREATVERPTEWEPYFHLAFLREQGDPLSSVQHLELAERLATRFPMEAETALVEGLLQEARPHDALSHALVALRNDPSRGELLLSLSNVYRALGDDARAAEYLQKFLNGFHLPTAIDVMNIDHSSLSERFSGGRPQVPKQHARQVIVVMTTFNSAVTIAGAMESVLSQSHRGLRLVVVDDGSTDETVERIEAQAAADPRVVLRRTNRNGGTYVAKNAALAEFEADYYAFHDSDDWMHPDHVWMHLDTMEEDATLACTLSQWIRMDQAGRCIARRTGGYMHDNPASTFFSKRVLDEVGFFDSVRTGADSELTWRIRRRFGTHAVKTLRAPLSIGLHHAESLTTRGAAAFNEHRYSPVRLAYWEAWTAWHRASRRDNAELYMAYPLMDRAFTAPAEILPAPQQHERGAKDQGMPA